MTELKPVRAQGVVENDKTSYTYTRPKDRNGNWLLGDLEDIAMHARTAGAESNTPMSLNYGETFSVELPIPAYQVTPVRYNTKALKFNKSNNTTVSQSVDRGVLIGLFMGIPFTAYVCLMSFFAPAALALTPIVALVLFIAGSYMANNATNMANNK